MISNAREFRKYSLTASHPETCRSFKCAVSRASELLKRALLNEIHRLPKHSLQFSILDLDKVRHFPARSITFGMPSSRGHS